MVETQTKNIQKIIWEENLVDDEKDIMHQNLPQSTSISKQIEISLNDKLTKNKAKTLVHTSKVWRQQDWESQISWIPEQLYALWCQKEIASKGISRFLDSNKSKYYYLSFNWL